MKELKQDSSTPLSKTSNNKTRPVPIEQGRPRLAAEFEAWYEVSFKVPETKAELTKADEDVDALS